MARLLAPLEVVSLRHPEPLIQGLAGDLRAIIATHGAYRPESPGLEGNRGATAPSRALPRLSPAATRPATEDGTDPTTTVRANPRPSPPPVDVGRSRTHGSPPKKAEARSTAPTAATGPGLRAPLPEPPRAFSDWLLEACDPDVPTRAVALRRLTRMVQERHPEALQAQEKVLLVGGDRATNHEPRTDQDFFSPRLFFFFWLRPAH